jgi:hypothetical protein
MPVATLELVLEPVLEVPTCMVPVLTIVLLGLPETDIPLVLDVIAPLLTMVVGVGPVMVTPVLVPPLIVPLFKTVVVGTGAVGLLMTTGPTVWP